MSVDGWKLSGWLGLLGSWGCAAWNLPAPLGIACGVLAIAAGVRIAKDGAL